MSGGDGRLEDNFAIFIDFYSPVYQIGALKGGANVASWDCQCRDSMLPMLPVVVQ